jgi:hypothetical protein
MPLHAHCIWPAVHGPLPPGLSEIVAGDVAVLVSDDWPGPERHLAVIETACGLAPTLPLPPGATFAAAEPLRTWLGQRRASLTAALRGVAGRAEWLLTLEEDAAAHRAWLAAEDPGLAAPCSPIEAARRARLDFLAGRLARLTAAVAPLTAAPLPAGAVAAWTLLATEPTMALLMQILETEARILAPTGLGLALAGPGPAFAFARRALLDG